MRLLPLRLFSETEPVVEFTVNRSGAMLEKLREVEERTRSNRRLMLPPPSTRRRRSLPNRRCSLYSPVHLAGASKC